MQSERTDQPLNQSEQISQTCNRSWRLCWEMALDFRFQLHLLHFRESLSIVFVELTREIDHVSFLGSQKRLPKRSTVVIVEEEELYKNGKSEPRG
uniref:Uncharacterized protein n=1 Tax=Pristionchus pacificus TaxID=54126 RepID=A0A2A6BSN7_PRIPA|eukprot:PDM68877.1 hypothetical protein PRIPAC_47179 [Pristionchus pacificus]